MSTIIQNNITQTSQVQPDLATEFQACVATFQAGNFEQCLQQCLSLQKHYPDNIDITYVTALCYASLGLNDAAETAYEKCAAIVKTSDELYCNMGLFYEKNGDIEKAITYYNNALAVNANSIAAINNLGNIYNTIGKNDLALECFNKLVSIGHNSYYIYNNIALVYKKLGMLNEALAAMNQCLSANPQNYQPYHNAALIYTAMGNKQYAIACYEIAYQFAPTNTQVISEYRDLCVNVCDWQKHDELEKCFQALMNNGGDGEVVSPMSNIQKNINLKENLECAIAYTNQTVKNILKTNKPFNHQIQRQKAARKIRLAYVSSDIKDHPVAHLMRGVFRCHNKAQFEVFLYSSSDANPNDKSGYRDAIKGYCDHFIDIRNTSNLDLAYKIYADEIDILVDLNGHTGISRLEMLALKPAPIQISYIGFIGSMGASFIDYIICDEIVTPPQHQQYYTEKFLYMPHCYQANDDALAISAQAITKPEAGLPEEGFIFCSFNQTYKIEAVLFKTWMNILKRVPKSVLWLYKGSIFVADNLARENLLKNAAAHGVDPARLIFADGIPIDQHLKRASLADLALDTRIYNGGTVTSHTLWAGVPVLTLQGGHFASRMASSIVNAAGIPELITQTPEEYEELAVKIATKKGEATRLKNKLAKNLPTCALFNTSQFTKDIEQLYKNAWNDYTSK